VLIWRPTLVFSSWPLEERATARDKVNQTLNAISVLVHHCLAENRHRMTLSALSVS